MKHKSTTVKVVRVPAFLAVLAIVGSSTLARIPAAAGEVDAKGMYVSEARGGRKIRRAPRITTAANPPSAAAEEPAVYRLLFPSGGAALKDMLRAGEPHPVPWKRGRHFLMDNDPGIEKLYLVVSPTRLEDLERLVAPGNGEFVEDGGEPRLTARLAALSGNASVTIGKGIVVDSYGVGVDSEKPFMTEVDPAHYPRSSSSSNAQ